MASVPLARGMALGHAEYESRTFHGCKMRVAQNLMDSVVYLGHGEETFVPRGTGFLLEYGGTLYLVTAQHVAENLGEDPFFIRANRVEGQAHNFHVDYHMEGDPLVRWFGHEKESIDLAITPFPVDVEGEQLQAAMIRGAHMAKLERPMKDAGCGDMCHVIGLFSHRPGVKRNMPVVHTGHIAAMCDSEELIPVSVTLPNGESATKYVEGYLVELSNLGGLSGAPVVVRGGIQLNLPVEGRGQRTIMTYTDELKLLGVWQGSWNRAAVGAKHDTVAMGIVTPAHRLLELLESEPVAENRRALKERARAATAD